MLNLNKLNSAKHSIEIANSAGQALAIDGSGFLTISNTSFAVTATNLDIRDLLFASDSVDVSGSSVTVSATDLDIRDLAFASDSVTAYQGGTWALAIDTISSWKVTHETVGLTAAEMVATPLANRTQIEIQNLSNKDIAIGPATGVTLATGMTIPAGNSYSKGLSSDVDVWAIGEAAGTDIEVVEYAA